MTKERQKALCDVALAVIGTNALTAMDFIAKFTLAKAMSEPDRLVLEHCGKVLAEHGMQNEYTRLSVRLVQELCRADDTLQEVIELARKETAE